MDRNSQDKPLIKRASFDGIANKFDQNIYGTSKGKLRHMLLLNYLAPYLDHDSPLKVLDAGGGTGVMSFEFAHKGHNVTLRDHSADVLRIARERLSQFDNVVIQQSELVDNNAESFDLIICHAVMEWLDDPLLLLDSMLSKLKPNTGVLSLSFFNHDAMLLNNVLYGNFDYVNSGMKVKNKVRLNPHNPQRPADIIAYITQLPSYQLFHHAGIRCFHDYMLDKSKIEHEFDALYELELQHGIQHPFKWIGKYCHLMIKRN